MDIKAYVYIESSMGVLCFKCAVKAIVKEQGKTDCFIEEKEGEFDLALEMGDTGDGNDMRTPPRCVTCEKRIEEHFIG